MHYSKNGLQEKSKLGSFKSSKLMRRYEMKHTQKIIILTKLLSSIIILGSLLLTQNFPAIARDNQTNSLKPETSPPKKDFIISIISLTKIPIDQPSETM